MQGKRLTKKKSLRVGCKWPCGCYNTGVSTLYLYVYANLLCPSNNDLLFLFVWLLSFFFLVFTTPTPTSLYQVWNIMIGSRTLSNTLTPHPDASQKNNINNWKHSPSSIRTNSNNFNVTKRAFSILQQKWNSFLNFLQV